DDRSRLHGQGAVAGGAPAGRRAGGVLAHRRPARRGRRGAGGSAMTAVPTSPRRAGGPPPGPPSAGPSATPPSAGAAGPPSAGRAGPPSAGAARRPSAGPPAGPPSAELIAAGFALENADAPVLHHGINLADLAHLLDLGSAGVIPPPAARRMLALGPDAMAGPAGGVPSGPPQRR